MVEGSKCRDLILSIQKKITPDDLKNLTLSNKLKKVSCLVSKTNEIVITKFIDSIWLKYNFYSDLGDQLLTIDEFIRFYPYLTKEELMAEKNLEKEYRV